MTARADHCKVLKHCELKKKVVSSLIHNIILYYTLKIILKISGYMICST